MNRCCLSLAVFAVICAITSAQSNCTRTLDLVFVVDGSNSMLPFNFKTVTDAIRTSVQALAVAPGNTRVAIVTFGDGVSDTVPLTDDKNSLLTALEGLKWPDGSTNTHLAIEWATAELLNKGRQGVPQAIVLITDGESNDANRTAADATAAKNAGIQLYAVGVGPYLQNAIEELKNLASGSAGDRVFILDTFEVLTQELDAITLQVCQDVQLECDNGVDVVLVLDGSNSVVRPNFDQLLTDVAASADNFWTVSPASRIGIITFSSFVYQNVPLTEAASRSAFTTAVKDLDFPDGSTATAEALDAASNLLLTEGRGGAVGRVMVVITDGESDNPTATAAAALAAKNQGISIFAIGVGMDRAEEKTEILKIASTPSQAVEVANFNVLTMELTARLQQLCGTSSTTTTTSTITSTTTTTTTTTLPPPSALPPIQPECSKALDLVFLIDGSSDVGSQNFQILKDAARSAALYFNIGQTTAHVAIHSYSNVVTGGFFVTEDRNDVDAGIQQLTYSGGSRAVTQALGTAFSEYFMVGASQAAGVRENVPHVAILVTTGPSDNPPQAAYWASELQRMGAHVFALGVTDAVTDGELLNLTNNAPNQQFRANTYSFVQSQLVNIAGMICAKDFSITTTTTPSTTTTTTTTESTPSPSLCSPINDVCNRSRMVYGIGFTYDDADCSTFYQCYPRADNCSLAVRRTCPSGQFWDQGRLKCAETCEVECAADPCKNKPEAATFTMTGNCRGYWTCVAGRSRPRCCPEGQGFVEGQGCLEECTCKDLCGPTACKGSGVCDLKPDWTNPGMYSTMMASFGWVSAQCPSGTFNITSCSCN